MLYTIKDIKDRIDELDSEVYVSVSIDGIPRGIALVSDVKEQICKFYGDSRKKKIKKMFLSGVTYNVKKGINLYAVPKEQFWQEVNREVPVTDIFGRKTEGFVIGGDEDKADNCQQEKPLVEWDAEKGVFHFFDIPFREERDKHGESAAEPKKKSPKEKSSQSGLFSKVIGWIKGDVGYKR